MKNDPTEQKKDLICKSNALIEAKYQLSTNEHRILLACMAQITQRETELDDQTLYTVTARDIAEATGVARQTAYRDLRLAAQRLYERSLCVPYGPDGKEPVIRKFRWVQEVHYCENDGQIKVRFSTPILPYLNKLSRQFTTYHLDEVQKLTSSFAIRFYELLLQWRTTGERVIECQQLRQMLGLGDKYPKPTDLRNKVINIAVDQINRHTPLWAEHEYVKSGRSIIGFRFRFGLKKDEAEKASETESVKKDESRVMGYAKSILEREARPGETYADVATRLRSARPG